MKADNRIETRKRRTLPEAAKPYRWKKGCPSPNPGGRPKSAFISEALRKALARGKADELAEILCALAAGRRKGTALQLAAVREISDRTEGKPIPRTQPFDFDNGPLPIAFYDALLLDKEIRRREAKERDGLLLSGKSALDKLPGNVSS